MSGSEIGGFVATKINSVQITRISDDIKPALMTLISDTDSKTKKPGTSKDNITPTVTIICE